MNNQPIEKVTRQTLSQLLADADNNIYYALKHSIYPGAKDESIGMVLAYCKAKKYDPIGKPVHIVPMSVKNAQTGNNEWMDVIMPGIGSYRIDAHRTGLYLGISAPEYGPMVTEQLGDCEITYPEWCKIIVEKFNPASGKSSFFEAKELWKENYANKGRDKTTRQLNPAPNEMWRKRPNAQLAKCTEAQALRKAFPEVIGSIPTFEEMEGKELKNIKGVIEVIDNVTTIEQVHVDDLKQKIKQAGSQEIDICNYLKIESLEAMLAKDYAGIMRQLDKKILIKKKAESLAINRMLNSEPESQPVQEEIEDE
jgi:phage recombination protein Bet